MEGSQFHLVHGGVMNKPLAQWSTGFELDRTGQEHADNGQRSFVRSFVQPPKPHSDRNQPDTVTTTGKLN